MKKKVVILTELFPYSNKETFLESEIINYKNCDVYLFSCSANKSMHVRELKQANIKYFSEKDKNPWIERVEKIFRYFNSIISKDFRREFVNLKKNNKLNLSTLIQLLSFMSVAQHKYKWIKKELVKLGFKEDTPIIFYSYWMHFHAYTAILLRRYFKKSKVISRCHGFDLYEYRNKTNYIPLREIIISQLDKIHSISKNGKDYLEQRYPYLEMNVFISRLGTIDYGFQRQKAMGNTLRLVSCSWIVPVKRVDRIINALKKIDDINIEWTHFGDGILYDYVDELAKNQLKNKSNISYKLTGAICNKDILKEYSMNAYDIFINVSESEGTPVSIMEAISFGIPVIATDVGGVNEIVINGKSGFLLDKDFTDDELIEIIEKMYYMKEEEYLKLRQFCRSFWEENYSAEKNYNKFINNILEGNMKKSMLIIMYSMRTGGVEKALLNLLKSIDQSLFNVTLLFVKKEGEFLKYIPTWVKIEEIKFPAFEKSLLEKGSRYILYNSLKKLRFLQAIKVLISILQRKIIFKNNRECCDFFEVIGRKVPVLNEQYDIALDFHGYTSFTTFYVSEKVNAKIKATWIHCEIKATCMNCENLDTSIRNFIRYYKKYDYIFGVSKQCIDEFVTIFPEIKEKCHTFYNIVLQDEIRVKGQNGKGFLDNFDGLRILTVGRLSIQKGYDMAIKISSRLKLEGIKFKWYVIGDGAERKNLMKLIEEYDVKDIFILLGYSSNPYPYIKECDIYVQPSRFEGYCTTLTEAKIFNKSIISTDVSGAREQITDGVTGIIVPFDEDEVYKAIKSLITDNELKQKFESNLSKEKIDNLAEIKKLYDLLN